MSRDRLSPFRVLEVGEWHRWRDADLSTNAIAVYCCLRTGPSTTRLLGLVPAGPGVICDDLGITPDEAEAALAELADADLVAVDPKRRAIYLPGVIDKDLPGNGNIAKSMAKDLATFPDCNAVAGWLKELFGLPQSESAKRLRKAVESLREQFPGAWPNDCDNHSGNHSGNGSGNGSGNQFSSDPKPPPLPSPPSPVPSFPSEAGSTEPPGEERKEGATWPEVAQEAHRLAGLLAGLMRENDPKAKTPRDLTAWAIELDRLHRIDGRDWPEIETVLRWSQADSFWRSNVLSAGKLRKQFSSLLLKSKATDGKPATDRKHRPELEDLDQKLARQRAGGET